MLALLVFGAWACDEKAPLYAEEEPPRGDETPSEEEVASRPQSGPCITFDPAKVYLMADLFCVVAHAIVPVERSTNVASANEFCISHDRLDAELIDPETHRLSYNSSHGMRRLFFPKQLDWSDDVSFDDTRGGYVAQPWPFAWRSDEAVDWPFNHSLRVKRAPDSTEMVFERGEGTWYWSFAPETPREGPSQILAIAHKRAVLAKYTQSYRIERFDGSSVEPPSPLKTFEPLFARHHGEGLFVAMRESWNDPGSPMHLVQTDADHAMTLVGQYASLPGDVSMLEDVAMAADGALYVLASLLDPGDGTPTPRAVLRLPLLPEEALSVMAWDNVASECPARTPSGDIPPLPKLELSGGGGAFQSAQLLTGP